MKFIERTEPAFFLKSQVSGIGICKNKKFLKVSIMGTVYGFKGEYELVDKIFDISQREIKQNGLKIKITEEWQDCDDQKITHYESGQQYFNILPKGVCKMKSWGSPSVSSTLVWNAT